MAKKISTTLLILSILLGGAATAWLIYRWESLPPSGDVIDEVTALADLSWIIGATVLGLWLIGYIFTLDFRRMKRPWLLIIPSGIVSGLPIAVALRELISAYEVIIDARPALDNYLWGLMAGCALGPVIIVVVFEAINRAIWTKLARYFDGNDMAMLAMMTSKLSLVFSPGEKGILRSVTLRRFRKGTRGDVVDTLKELYTKNPKDPDILEALCKNANEEKDREAYLKYLEELHALLPEEDEIREILIDVLIDYGHGKRALQLIENSDMEESEESLERYGLALLGEGQLEKATEVCGRLGEVEGIPFRRSQAMLREILSRRDKHYPALNILAAQARRMALRDQEIRWLEKSFEANPNQREVRDKLVAIYRDLGQTVRLEELIKDVVAENPDDFDLQFEFATILYENDKDEEALAKLEQLNQDEDATAESHFLAAKIHFEADVWDKAKVAAEKADKLDPEPEVAKKIRSLLNKVEQAVLTEEVAEIITEARENPDDWDLQLQALQKLIEGEHVDKVTAHTDEILTRNPTLRPMVVEHLRAYAEKPEVPFRILNLLSDLLATMNKFDETLEVLKQMVDRSVDPVATIRESSHKILRRSPHHLPTLKFLGDIYKEHGRFTDMIHSYSLYLSNGGEETEDMVRSLCEAYIALGDYQNAKKFSKRLLEIEPDKIEFLRDLVVLANRSDAPEDAAEYLKKLEMANPRDRKVQALKLETEHALGERRFNFLKQEQETGEGGGETLEKLGDLAMEMEKIQDAITYFQRASRDKENPILARRCMAKLALAYMKKRLDQLAAETLRSIKISQTDDDPNEVAIIMDIYYQIGLIFEEFKFYEKAEQVFTQILRIDAGYRDVLDRVEGLRR